MTEPNSREPAESDSPTPTVPGKAVQVDGLDGGTPLGFIAALGLLKLLTQRVAAKERGATPTLSWRMLDAWRPLYTGVNQLENIVTAVHEDAQAWCDAPLLGFKYLKIEKDPKKKGSFRTKTVGGLRAPVGVLQAWLLARRDANDESSVEYARALMTEEATEAIKQPVSIDEYREASITASEPLDASTERTFFDFTARNAQFLEQVEQRRSDLTPHVVLSAMEQGEADPEAERSSLDWDPSADAPGAIYTGFRRGFLPVHEWLAFRGLAHFPLAVRGSKVLTTGCTGRRLDGEFVWPLWEAALSADVARSLVAYPGLGRMKPQSRRAMGIAAVLCAGLTKKADGRSGTFSPSRPV